MSRHCIHTMLFIGGINLEDEHMNQVTPWLYPVPLERNGLKMMGARIVFDAMFFPPVRPA